MKQYSLNDKTLTLKVKKSPFIIRGIMFFLSFTSFILPLLGITIGIKIGKGLHIGYFVGLFLFGLLGFYLLRISLWNTFGKETIIFSKSTIEYVADYRWFKDGKKNITLNKELSFWIEHVGYTEDNVGNLIIGNENERIESVVKIPITQLKKLLIELKNNSQ